MRRRVVPEFDHQRMPIERGLDDAALDPASAAMNDPDAIESCGCCGSDVLVHDGRDVARREGMQVDLAFDGNLVRQLSPSRDSILASPLARCDLPLVIRASPLPSS